MKYQVMGSNKDTGARMTLEFEAESKAAAERKAAQSGMQVHHVRDVSDGHVPTATEPRGPSRRRGSGLLVKLILLAAIVVAAYYFVWPMING